MVADPSFVAVDSRGGVESDGALEVEGGMAEQFFGLGPRLKCGDVNGATVAGATAVDMTAEVARPAEVSDGLPTSQNKYFRG